MPFGPLQLQTGAERPFAVAALSPLLGKPEWRLRLWQRLGGRGEPAPATEVQAVFFAQVGEGLFRELHERPGALDLPSLEGKLNEALKLPEGFRWHRDEQNRLTPPSRWRAEHHLAMAEPFGSHASLRKQLAEVQEALGAEADLALQAGDQLWFLMLCLGPPSRAKATRLRRQADLLQALLGYSIRTGLLFPDHLARPEWDGFRAEPWGSVAAWFGDAPEIAGFIRSFAFLSGGRWQSALAAPVAAPGATLADVLRARLLHRAPEPVAEPVVADVAPEPPGPPAYVAWGAPFIRYVLEGCKNAGVWPLKHIWTGHAPRMGPFPEAEPPGPVWMVEDERGLFRTSQAGFQIHDTLNPKALDRWKPDEIITHFQLVFETWIYGDKP